MYIYIYIYIYGTAADEDAASRIVKGTLVVPMTWERDAGDEDAAGYPCKGNSGM